MMNRFRAGMVFSEEVTLSPALVESFAQFSGDHNPLHLQAEAAKEYGFARPFAHGAIQSAIVSKLIGMKVPGPGAVWMSQSMEWLKPLYVGDTVRVEVEIESISPGAEVLSLVLRAANQQGEQVMQGNAKVKLASKLAEQPQTETKEPRVALVTGGSRGIGAETAHALGMAGWQVAVACHSNRHAAEEVVQRIAGSGAAAQAFTADLQAEGSGTALVRDVEAAFGRLDAIVHCATHPVTPVALAELSSAGLRKYHRIHVEAAWELVQAALPGMQERRFGRLIFLGTTYLFGAPPARLAAYVAAKQGLWGLVRCLALELGPQQITVNMLSPGMTVTDLTSDIPVRMKEAEARRVPLRRLAMPQDVAGAVAFLAGDEGGYISGVNLPLTGGPV